VLLSDSSASVSAASDDDKKKGLFSKLKSAIPPASERQKLVPLALMFFCILFNYTILRDTKDVLMVTAPKSGAEGTHGKQEDRPHDLSLDFVPRVGTRPLRLQIPRF